MPLSSNTSITGRLLTAGSLFCLILGGGFSTVQARELAPVEEIGQRPSPSKVIAKTSPPAASLEDRVAKIERLLENRSMVEMLVQLQAVQQEIQQMRGALEEQGYRLEGVKNRQRDLYLDIDRRMGNLERSLAQLQDTVNKAAIAGQVGTTITPPPVQMTPPPSMMVTPPSVIPPPTVTEETVDPLHEQTTYQQAFTLLKEGRYEQAIAGFKSYLEQYPQGRYADNAQYWLGEAYYVTRQFDLARMEFSKVEANKQNRKRPDAMLKLGYTYYELKDWDQARAVLQAIVTEYPNSTVERLASKRLQDMKQANQ